MNDKIITALLAILIALGGWTLSRTFSLSQDMVLVKEKITQMEKQMDEAVGINVITGEEDYMLHLGIIDPVLVTRTALKNAVSVVSTIISADCVISNIRINEGS